jgi:DNA-binding transcriptional MerR regulator
MAANPSTAEHLSIGEVLSELRGEFPDITISKIRFLESQGLIDPERTPSGYRKFYEPDVARLRWILRQQKDNFLPLKVIKGRLEDAGPGALPDEGGDDGTTATSSASTKSRASRSARATPKAPPTKPAKRTRTKAAPKAATSRASTPSVRQAMRPTTPAKKSETNREALQLLLDDGSDNDLEGAISGASLTRAELAAGAGLTEAAVLELEDYGLLEAAAGEGDRVLFDEAALAIAQLCAAFAKHGIQPRHLRMYRSFAEREAMLYGQVVQPVMRQRNPEAHVRAREDLVELAQLGRRLRTAFLRKAAGDLVAD